MDRIAVYDRVSTNDQTADNIINLLQEIVEGVGWELIVMSVNSHICIHQSDLDTSTPSGRMMFQMVGAFFEFERYLNELSWG